MNAPIPLRLLEISVGSGDALDVRHFRVSERMNGLFEVTIIAVSPNPDIDMDAVAGGGAGFTVHGPTGASRSWSGIASRMRQIAAEERGLSTYQVTIVPRLWLLTQNTDYRIFQQMSEIDIVLKVLGKWGISPSLKLTGAYKKRKYRVQYDESDYDFVCRMLEDAGVSFYFEDGDTMVLSDSPEANPSRGTIPFRDKPTTWSHEHVTEVQVERAVKPGKVTLRDHDYRKPPSYKLLASANGAGGVEGQIERYHYTPGAFLFEAGKGEPTPSADDKGKYRVDEGEAGKLASRRLSGCRAGAKSVSFRTNVIDLAPGTVVSFSDHPKASIGGGQPYLVTGVSMEGRHDGEWLHTCQAGAADAPFQPERKTPRPRVTGVESATVVGPPGEEIHVDEFGRVRVHFHWDRDSQMDDKSSCWIHVSQPWGGSGYGGLNLPRVGQEVLVDFLGGDPDRPVIIGRTFTNLQRVPYKLPENKTQTVFRSQSTNGKEGYNEILYEDRAGVELFKVQAERDYVKYVKHDSITTIDNDLVQEVRRDETLKVGRNRTRLVGGDEGVHIQGNQSISVGEQQRVTVDGDRTIHTHGQQDITVDRDESIRILQDQDIIVGQNQSIRVAGNRRENIDKNNTIAVTNNRTATIGQVDSIEVGDKHHIEVRLSEGEKGKSAKAAGGSAAGGGAAKGAAGAAGKTGAAGAAGKTGAAGAAQEKERTGPTSQTMIDKKIVFTTGDGATITMDGATVTIEADVIVLKAKNKIEADAETETVSIHAKKDIAVKSDQTMHLATKGGAMSLQTKGGALSAHAGGGDVKVSTDRSIRAEAASNVNINAKQGEAWLMAQTRVALSSPELTTVEGKVALLNGENVTVDSTKLTTIHSDGMAVRIDGRLVRINCSER